MLSSGQLRSMSGLVDLSIQAYCCEISDFKGTLHLKSSLAPSGSLSDSLSGSFSGFGLQSGHDLVLVMSLELDS